MSFGDIQIRKLARDAKISVYCIGLTATPNEDLPSTKFMVKPVQIVAYTPHLFGKGIGTEGFATGEVFL